MAEEEIIYSCEDHVEIALDDFINEADMAPSLIKISDDSKKCNYCGKHAVYEVLK